MYKLNKVITWNECCVNIMELHTYENFTKLLDIYPDINGMNIKGIVNYINSNNLSDEFKFRIEEIILKGI